METKCEIMKAEVWPFVVATTLAGLGGITLFKDCKDIFSVIVLAVLVVICLIYAPFLLYSFRIVLSSDSIAYRVRFTETKIPFNKIKKAFLCGNQLDLYYINDSGNEKRKRINVKIFYKKDVLLILYVCQHLFKFKTDNGSFTIMPPSNKQIVEFDLLNRVRALGIYDNKFVSKE